MFKKIANTKSFVLAIHVISYYLLEPARDPPPLDMPPPLLDPPLDIELPEEEGLL